MDAALRVPPHSIEAEQAVLGGLMISPGAWDTVDLDEQDFYRRDHRVIYSAMSELMEMREPVDVLTVIDRLRDREELEAAGGHSYIGALPKNTPASSNTRAYAERVKAKAQERRLLQAATDIGQMAWEAMPLDEKIDKAGQLVSEISGEKARTRGMSEILRDAVDSLEERFNAKGHTGLTTGFHDIDRMLNGLDGGEFVVLAARPSVGKTTLAMNIAEHVAKNKNVMVFSLEMPDVQLINRSICSLGRVDFGRFRAGDLRDDEWTRVTSATSKLNNAHLTIDDTGGLTVAQVRSRARKVMHENGLDLVVVDYLQLMRGEGENRTNEIANISRGLKALSKELNIPVITLSQLNRSLENRPNKRPQMSDLRDSGAIEQDADVIIFLYREEVYVPDTHLAGIAEAHIAKQRNGPIGTINLTFLGHHCRFENFAGQIPEAPTNNVKGFDYEGRR